MKQTCGEDPAGEHGQVSIRVKVLSVLQKVPAVGIQSWIILKQHFQTVMENYATSTMAKELLCGNPTQKQRFSITEEILSRNGIKISHQGICTSILMTILVLKQLIGLVFLQQKSGARQTME